MRAIWLAQKWPVFLISISIHYVAHRVKWFIRAVAILSAEDLLVTLNYVRFLQNWCLLTFFFLYQWQKQQNMLGITVNSNDARWLDESVRRCILYLMRISSDFFPPKNDKMELINGNNSNLPLKQGFTHLRFDLFLVSGKLMPVLGFCITEGYFNSSEPASSTWQESCN